MTGTSFPPPAIVQPIELRNGGQRERAGRLRRNGTRVELQLAGERDAAIVQSPNRQKQQIQRRRPDEGACDDSCHMSHRRSPPGSHDVDGRRSEPRAACGDDQHIEEGKGHTVGHRCEVRLQRQIQAGRIKTFDRDRRHRDEGRGDRDQNQRRAPAPKPASNHFIHPKTATSSTIATSAN